MPRAYTVATAALALGAETKWLDNVLSHHRVPGIAQKRQGISRRLTIDGFIILALTILLIEEFGIPTPSALKIAEEIARNDGRYRSPQGIQLELDFLAFESMLLDRLERAVEIAPLPKRGRPPNKTGRLT